MDIQGAFDTVSRNRLVLRLREQGWPDHLARWAGSFISGRSARVRYQDTLTPSSPLQYGLPQASPVSPILFLLYTEPIYRLGNPQGRFGYADDIAILSIGDTGDETTAMASGAIDEMVCWGATNGVSFDSKKTEVMNFSRSKLMTAPAPKLWSTIYEDLPTRNTARCRPPYEAPSGHVSSPCYSMAPRPGTRAQPGRNGVSLPKTYRQSTSISYRE
uniref:Reverse transcriptase domain-containing protein n=1 Tax=Fusarium oxysporum (strain Fo5176) TaxID=660025 RepID=A0A0D2XRS8_FUSOF